MHIIPFKGRLESTTFNLNLLYNEDKIYVMDNHLAASWCWLQKIDTNRQYNLLHIDRHYDLSNGQTDWWVDALRNQNINLQNISIQALTSIKYKRQDMPSMDSIPVFRWDNYLPIFNELHPNLLDRCLFATHKDGNKIDEIEFEEIDAWSLHKNLSYWLNNNDNIKWIVNLDIDYFFSDVDDEYYFQLFGDEFIMRIAEEIRLSMNKIEVLTIALSPEMCGGWDKAERIAQLILTHLNVQWIE